MSFKLTFFVSFFPFSTQLEYKFAKQALFNECQVLFWYRKEGSKQTVVMSSGLFRSVCVDVNQRPVCCVSYAGCPQQIGPSRGRARLCEFSGQYYCDSCHRGDTTIIPSRMVHNWDLTQREVGAAHADHSLSTDICTHIDAW